jgi:hypothetical protein
MSALPTVTAVIPVYNGEEFLADAISSVLGQTYPAVECVVVDDGSTDGTGDVVARFGSAVRYVRQANGGVSSARNAGAAAAHGDYLAFLDADDMWHAEKVARHMAVFQADGDLGLVYSALLMVDRTGAPLARLDAPNPDVALRNTLLMEPPTISVAQAAIVPTAVFRDAGGFDERLSTSADCDLACRVAARVPIAAVFDPLTLYRLHPGQMHQNLVALERDMTLVLEKLFSSGVVPDELRPLRARAHANLSVTLSLAYRRADPRRAVSHLAAALRYDARRTAAVLVRTAFRRLGKEVTAFR